MNRPGQLAVWGVLAIAASSRAEPLAAFGPGEQSTYVIQYLGVTGGTAQITVGASTPQWGHDVWPIVTVAKSDPSLVFFPVKDKYVTYWDPSSSHTVGGELLADENHHRRRERIRLDHAQKTATVTKQKEGEEESTSSIEIPDGAMDIAAATFTLRSQPLAVGASFELPVFTGNKTFTLHAKVEGRQVLKTASGDHDVFKLRVQTSFSGTFASKRDLVAYISTDASHLPLRVEAEFALGTLVAELTDYKPGAGRASN